MAAPAHLVDVLVPVEHVAVLADPVQVLQHAQARARAAAQRVSRVNTLEIFLNILTNIFIIQNMFIIVFVNFTKY